MFKLLLAILLIPTLCFADGSAIVYSPASSATPALDNLASVAVNASIIPASDSAIDLGASTPKYFANAYIDKVNTPAIAFPATQIADAGANVLDDYEEGTWTAAFACATGTITISASKKTGLYTKIGRQVTVTGYFDIDSVSSPTGTFTITGLPFTSTTIAGMAGGIYLSGAAATATTMIIGRIDASDNAIYIFKYAAGAIANTAADVQGGGDVRFSFTYFTS